MPTPPNKMSEKNVLQLISIHIFRIRFFKTKKPSLKSELSSLILIGRSDINLDVIAHNPDLKIDILTE